MVIEEPPPLCLSESGVFQHLGQAAVETIGLGEEGLKNTVLAKFCLFGKFMS